MHAAWWVCALAGTTFLALGANAQAQTKTVRLAKQFGISYLPLTVMQQNKLLEEHAKKLGVDVATEWVKFTGGTPMNEAIISGNLDFASGGVGPLLNIWGKTRGNLDVKGVTAINAMPLFLNTVNPAVRSIKDFTDKDRIALPAVKVSIQAVTLQMAAEKAFGAGQHGKLDNITVSLSHPDGMAQLLSGKSEITGHFTSAPFMYQELEDRRVHKVLDSYDVLGGPHTFNVIWATAKFRDENPKIFQAFLSALDEAIKQIGKDPAGVAALWVKAENSKLSPAYIEKLIRAPENEWTMTPKKVMAYADYMHRVGMLKTKPSS
ncbi:MAG: ABC transporter substrate-binding protein, partial [Proteobacteria bacterium]|nr:ABC transporter substrate-binding protein [Pseudomonadota bacterium]